MTKIIELINATVDVDNGFEDAKTILDNVTLTIYEHDFFNYFRRKWSWKINPF